MSEESVLQSVKVVKAERIPAETRVKHSLPKTGFIEVRIERHSDPAPVFKTYTKDQIPALRTKLSEKDLLF